MDKKKFYILILLNGFFILWFDAIYSTDSFLGFSLNNIGYHLKLYIPLLIILWLPLFMFFPERKKELFGGLLISWTINDLFWFLVNPYEWIKFWSFSSEIIFEFHIFNGYILKVSCFLMAISIILRLLFGFLLLFNEKIKIKNDTIHSII